MSSKSDSFEAKVIGHVKNDIPGGKVEKWSDVISEIVLEDDYEALLDGIEDFSHILIIFWMDKVVGYRPKVHPKNREDIPEKGVFATRTPFRPNPIGVSAVRLIRRSGPSVRVLGLDCYDGTPVLDIKPYTPKDLKMNEIRIPKWMEELFGKEG